MKGEFSSIKNVKGKNSKKENKGKERPRSLSTMVFKNQNGVIGLRKRALSIRKIFVSVIWKFQMLARISVTFLAPQKV